MIQDKSDTDICSDSSFISRLPKTSFQESESDIYLSILFLINFYEIKITLTSNLSEIVPSKDFDKN
jgi:hypothetical protein